MRKFRNGAQKRAVAMKFWNEGTMADVCSKHTSQGFKVCLKEEVMSLPRKISSWTILFAVAAAALGTAAANGRALEFTTKSEAAKKGVEEITIAIESFAPGQNLQAISQKISEADPDFAFGVMIQSLFQPPPQATETLKKSLEMAENATEGERLYIKGMVHSRSNELAEAIEVFEELAEKLPDERRVYMMLGQLEMGQGHIALAARHFAHAEMLDSSTGRVNAFIGNILLMEGDFSGARKLYQRAYERAPNSIPFQAHSGEIFSLLYEDEIDHALEASDRYMKNYMSNGGPQGFPEVFIWNLKARINLENGRLEAALEDYEKGLKSIENSVAAGFTDQQKKTWIGRYHHGRGRTLAKMGKHDEAWAEVKTLKVMIDEGGDQGQQFLPAFHYLAGYCKLEAGEYASAIDHLRQAAPNDPFQLLLLARAYEKYGDPVKARITYQKVADFKLNTMERALSNNEAVEALKKSSE